MKFPKDIEALKQKHAAELAQAEADNKMAAALPVPVDMIIHGQKKQPYIVLEPVDTINEAIELLSKLRMEPIAALRDSCTSVLPEHHAQEKGSDKIENVYGPGTYAELYMLDYKTHPATDLTLECFSRVDDERIAKISVKVKRHPFRLHFSSRNKNDAQPRWPVLGQSRRIGWYSGGDWSLRATYLWDTFEDFKKAMQTALEGSDEYA